MSYISFGNLELFEFVNPEKYLQSILNWDKKHTVRFEPTYRICTGCGKKFHPNLWERHVLSVGAKPESHWGHVKGPVTYDESTRFEVGDIIDLFWRSRVPVKRKEWLHQIGTEEYQIGSYQDAMNHNGYRDTVFGMSHERKYYPAHNLSDIIGKAVITDVYQIRIVEKKGQVWFSDLREDKHTYEEDWDVFAKEDGFESIEKFEGYFSKHLKTGEYKVGTVYEYEKEE